MITIGALRTRFPASPRAVLRCEPVQKDRASDLSEIERLAAKLEPPIQKAILEALEAQHDAVTLSALVEALKTGSLAKVMAVLDTAMSAASMAKVEQALLGGATAAGISTAGNIARITRTEFQFGVLNPRLIGWLQTYSLGLIRDIDDKTREAIRNAAIDGMRAGKSPIDTARQIREVVGLTPRQAAAVANYRKELERFHLKRSADGYGLGSPIDRVNGRQVFRPDEDGSPKDGIDQRRLRDFRYDGELKAALANGKPLTKAQIDKMVDAYARKYLKYRSETIAKTEAMRTTNMGVHESWQQAIDTGKAPEALVRRMWKVAKDERLCSDCAPVPSLNPKRGVKMGQTFVTPRGPHLLPPLHPNCRCSVFIRLWEPSQLAGEPGS